jgi:hypothetical protein
MAIRTSVGTGLWSAAGTWDTGVPVDGDSAVIAAGHIVTFDVDQSAFAGLAGLTINGGLVASETAGAYVLKMASDIAITFGAAGYIQAGTSPSVLYPSDCSFQITLQGTGQITAGVNTCRFYGPGPTNKMVKLSGNEAIGQTAISVDTDLTADAMWAVGATVYIADINQAKEVESYTLAAGLSATEIALSGGGLTVAKSIGAVVTLSTRNIRIIGPGTTGTGISNGSVNTFMGVEFRGLAFGVGSCGTSMFTNCAFCGNTYGLYSWINNALTNCVFSGNIFGLLSCFSMMLTACLFSGNSNGVNACNLSALTTCAFYGNTTGANSCHATIFTTCLFSGNTEGANLCAGKFIDCTFETNTLDFNQPGANIGYKCLLNSPTQHANYLGTPLAVQTVMYDVDGVVGAIRAWTGGGKVLPDATTLPPSLPSVTFSHKYTFEQAATPAPTSVPEYVWLDFGGVFCPANKPTKFTVPLKKDTNSMTMTPQVQIIAPDDDPLAEPTASPLASAAMADDTNWQTLTFTYTPTIDRVVSVRIIGRHGSGNLWVGGAPRVTLPGGDTYPTIGLILFGAPESLYG